MKLRAAIFDVYGTLLEVVPATHASVSEAAWESLHQDYGHAPAAMPFTRFAEVCRERIDREHAKARALGVVNPEVFWPDIVAETLPGLRRLSDDQRGVFLQRLAGISRSVRLANGAGEVLRRLRQQGVVLGIASNAQAYTHGELAEALAPQGLGLSIFDPRLCFWSFENGFSKPNPHVFRMLTARLQALGLEPSEALMVGDRLDNDMEPARAFGWRTWHLHATGDGSWCELASWLESIHPPAHA